MRVLVVDQDSTLLTAISRTLGEYFSIDAVTTKADCLDLVRVNDFEVIVAGERLEDGSGLELLGSLARTRPGMLRIFAAERERLKLLKGRLGPFGLFRTLSYPIEPRQLLAALSAAAGIEEEFEESAEAPAPPPEPARRADPAAPVASRSQRSGAVSATPRPQPSVAEPSRAAVQRPRVGRPAGGALQTAAPQQAPRQPTPAALAAASKLDIVTRPKGFPPPGETTPGRSAFLVGAGVVLVLGGLALSFKIFNTKDEPITHASNVPATRSPHFPPEVLKLVADTEAAFQQDNFKTARTDVAALQQIAPDHPRLPFFEALLKRLEATTQPSSKSGPGKFLRHTSVPAATAGTRPNTQRRQPDTDRDVTSTGSASEPAARATVATFSGRTLEDSSLDTQDPRLTQRVTPDYPPEAARKGIEGSVDVSFTISPEGKVTDVAVTSAVPSDIFNRAAIAAVRRWKYEPKTVNGVPVAAHQQLRLQFKLDPRGE